ncbi:glutamate-rich protein 1 isoform X16 [Homo sapiens]|uniref:glutamate-rich protein 1 isoform X16 n=1 Tax=Homo sapiens TaxID=9606 RepID=UPI0023DEE400|nr:glutamate-rich protein 1 isoform X16 [Homo sapiens]
MAAHRKHVFVEKVLQRLFPPVPSGQGKREPQTLAVQNPPKKVTSEKVSQKHAEPLTDTGSETPTARRLYTASGPPEGYVPCWPEPSSCGSPENASSGDDTEDQDPHDQPKRRRIRKHKSKKKFKNPNNVLIEQAELEKQQSLLQEKSQRQHTDGTTISKNKKRKLKKKQQIKRKKAAGLAAKAAGVSFMYQPEDSSNEGEGVGEACEEDGVDTSEEDPTLAGEEDVKDTREEDGADASEEDLTRARQEEGADASEEDPTPAGEEDVKDAREEDGVDTIEEDLTRAGEEDGKDTREEDGADASEEDPTWAGEEEGADSGEEDGADASEEDDTITNEKAHSILNFLKSTQEMYFYDGVSRDAASAALADAAEELLDRLASHSMLPSDVSILYHMKTLLLLQDTERLKHALEMFPEHCTMPPAFIGSCRNQIGRSSVPAAPNVEKYSRSIPKEPTPMTWTQESYNLRGLFPSVHCRAHATHHLACPDPRRATPCDNSSICSGHEQSQTAGAGPWTTPREKQPQQACGALIVGEPALQGYRNPPQEWRAALAKPQARGEDGMLGSMRGDTWG